MGVFNAQKVQSITYVELFEIGYGKGEHNGARSCVKTTLHGVRLNGVIFKLPYIRYSYNFIRKV